MSDTIETTIEAYQQAPKDFYTKTLVNLKVTSKLVDLFLQRIGGNKILDVGCGPGVHSKVLSEQGYDTIGIDLSSELLKIAKWNDTRTNYLLMDMRKLEFPSESFDGLVSLSSLLHIPKPELRSTLDEFAKVLRKGGIALITLKRGIGESTDVSGRFFAYYEEEEIKSAIESSGFLCEFTDDETGDYINILATKL